MDELWQRYRTFWTPILIGLGVFLVGVIAVHVVTDDPDELEARVRSEERALARMEVPDRNALRRGRERLEKIQTNVKDWSARLNQTPGTTIEVVVNAADDALRASILRGASRAEAQQAAAVAPRFDDDVVAADLAVKRYRKAVQTHAALLQGGDPNVAFSQLLDDVWSELRVRANRADVELDADQLGFGGITSVTRATLPGRVLNLALVARIVDAAIRHGVNSVTGVRMSTSLDPGSTQDLIREWPVSITMVGDMSAMKRVLDLVTDSRHPMPIAESTTLTQPRRSREGARSGLVELNLGISSVLIQPEAPLDLESEGS